MQIGGGQIEQRSITASEIATGTLTANEIAANTITASQIAANTITASQIASATITTTQIAASTIVAANIATGTITADKLTVTAGGANKLLNSTFQVDTNADGAADTWAVSFDDNPVTAQYLATGGVDNRAFQRLAWTAQPGKAYLYTNNTLSGGIIGGWTGGGVYIVSFWAKGTASGTPDLYWGTAPASQTWLAQPALSTTWQLYSVRITLGGSLEADNQLTIRLTTSTADSSFDVDHVQVEAADTPSFWKPFPSEIEPGAITADKISVTSLAAIKVDTGALNLSGFLTIGAAGGIYQGSGTAAARRPASKSGMIPEPGASRATMRRCCNGARTRTASCKRARARSCLT